MNFHAFHGSIRNLQATRILHHRFIYPNYRPLYGFYCKFSAGGIEHIEGIGSRKRQFYITYVYSNRRDLKRWWFAVVLRHA